MTAEYLIGRKQASVESGVADYADALIAAQRYDDADLQGLNFRHTTIANTSFKGAMITSCTFENVVFIGCYFRDTRISSSQFRACKFIDCNMDRVDFRSTDLRFYNQFRGTRVPFDRVQQCLPTEGNLRRLLCDNLSREHARDGDTAEASKFRREAIVGERTHLREIARHRIPHYQEKYTNEDRAMAILGILRLGFFDAMWGRQRSYARILKNWTALGVLFATLACTSLRKSLGSGQESYFELALYGFLSVLPVSPPMEMAANGQLAFILLSVGRVLGFVLSGLFVSLLFDRVYEGRR